MCSTSSWSPRPRLLAQWLRVAIGLNDRPQHRADVGALSRAVQNFGGDARLSRIFDLGRRRRDQLG